VTTATLSSSNPMRSVLFLDQPVFVDQFGFG